MSGYLFKRASNAFKSWSRRWFILGDNRIVYQSESKAEVRHSQQQLAAATYVVEVHVLSNAHCMLLVIYF